MAAAALPPQAWRESTGVLGRLRPDGTRAWIFEVWWIPETFLPRPGLEGIPRPSPQLCTGEVASTLGGPSTRPAHTDEAVVFFFPSLPSRVQEEVRRGTWLLPGGDSGLLH